MYQFTKAGIIPLMSMPDQDIVFAPFEVTVAGGSLCYQLFLFRITNFFLWCKDNFKEDMPPDELEESLRKAFSLFWEKTELWKPDYLEISAKKPDPVKQVLVKIKVQPPRQVLLTGETVEMEFFGKQVFFLLIRKIHSILRWITFACSSLEYGPKIIELGNPSTLVK